MFQFSMVKWRNNYNEFRKTEKFKLLRFHVLVNVIFCAIISLSSYVHIPLSGIKDKGVYMVHLILLQFTVFGFIYFLALNRWVFRLIFNSLFLLLSLFSFWVYTQDISITDPLLDSVTQTKPSIVLDVLSYPYMLFIIFVILCLVFINRQYNKLAKRKNLLLASLAILSVAAFFIVESLRLGTLKSRLPYNAIIGISEYIFKDEVNLLKIKEDIKAHNTDIRVILVLGETVRADHLNTNGYDRITLPKLTKRPNLISYPNLYSPYGYTAASLSVILTNKDHRNENNDSLLPIYEVLNKAGYRTTWIGNQELEKGFKSIVETNSKTILADSLRSVFSFKKALDQELLTFYSEELNNASDKSFITLHMMGSHWYYNHRVTERYQKFKPITDSKYIPSQSKTQLINSYDNTLLYLDSFLDEVIEPLSDKESPYLVFYLSDHGELLGEDGLWLHAQDSEILKNPAMLVWYNNAFNTKYPKHVNALKLHKNSNFNTSFFYHSLLDLIEVEDFGFQENLSIFRLNQVE